MADMNQLLKETFELLVKEEFENRLEVPKHRFSLRFHRDMHKVFRNVGLAERKRKGGKKDSPFELYRPVRSRKRRIVFICLLFAIIGGTVFAAEPMIRWLHNYYMRQHADHVEIQKSEGKDNDISNSSKEFQKYRFTKLPDGYSFEEEKFDAKFQKYWICYSYSEENALILRQTWQEDGTLGNVTSDTKPLEDIEVNGFTGYYTEDSNMGTLILSDGIYKLVIQGPLSKEVLIELADGLELADFP